MVYTKPGLRGSPVHDYRDAASACNKHYDTHKFPEHVHKGRFLLKAEPQQGKTGMCSFQTSLVLQLQHVHFCLSAVYAKVKLVHVACGCDTCCAA